MPYQILIHNQPLQPTHGEPYVFKTLQEALDILDMNYGRESLGTFAKIIKVNENIPENILKSK